MTAPAFKGGQGRSVHSVRADAGAIVSAIRCCIVLAVLGAGIVCALRALGVA